MRDPAYPAVHSASTAPMRRAIPSRRTAVGEKYPGVYERANRHGDRVLKFDYYVDGRRRWKTLPPGTSLKQAVAARERLRTNAADGTAPPVARAPRLAEVWETWLDSAKVSLRPRTVEHYRHAMAGRVVSRLGARRVGEIDRRDVARLIRDLQASGLAGWTIRGTLVPLGLFMAWAEDEGLRRGNPVRDLRRRERPKVTKREHRNLTETDLWALVDAASDDRRAFVGVLAFAGLRASEALGLTWADVDLDGRVLRVRWQLDRLTRGRVEVKTQRARREVDLADGLAAILREWKLWSPFSAPSDFVVVARNGEPLDHRGAARRLDAIVRRAGLDVEGEPRVTPHQLRYSFGALLLEAALPVAVVSRMMGHVNEAVTQGIYSHEILRRDSGERTRAGMQAAFGRGVSGTNVERSGGQTRVNEGLSEGAEVVAIPLVAER